MNRKLAVKVGAGVVGTVVLALVLHSMYDRDKMDAPRAVPTNYAQLIDCKSGPYATMSIGGYTNVTCRGTVQFTVNLYPESTKVSYINLSVTDYPDAVMYSRPDSETAFIPKRSDLLLVYDTCRVPNGNHTATLLIGDPANLNHATDYWHEDFPVEGVSFRTENTISEFYAEKDLITARLSAFLADWKIDVLKGSGKSPETLKFQLVRSFQGRGREIRWVWDEKDNHGVHVKDRSATLGWWNKHGGGHASVYFYRITAMRGRKVLQQTELASSNDFLYEDQSECP